MMSFNRFNQLDLQSLPSPCFVVDTVAVEENLKILNTVSKQSGAKILHALKAFSMFSLADLTTQYLHGTCSSGLHEALLAREFYHTHHLAKEAPREIHVFAAGYSQADLVQLLTFAQHIVFNSPTQLLRFAKQCRTAMTARTDLSFGLRINPEHSEGKVALYDPCAPGSRLGTTRTQLDQFLGTPAFDHAFELISGLHFHTLCEHDFPPLQRTLATVEEKFSDLLPQMRWLNFGGGHHITHPDYQRDALIDCIQTTQQRYGVQVYLEPGEAVAIGSGVLIAEVLDIIQGDKAQAILDTSATCHMPDTLEMPYRADIVGADYPGVKKYTYRLGGLTCLAGDVIGDYSFDQPLSIGQRLIFTDMAHYTMVKTSTFNGTRLPAIACWNPQTNIVNLVREFDYQDFRNRLS